LNAAWQAASQEMYNAQQGAPQENAGSTAGNEGASNQGSGNAENVTDVEFEEVSDKK
jgi:molecular chaperone DnaK